ncbi:MAG: hypothetical protein IJ794_15580, partial [Lachnospiraceae bacterium]|nr:hypothetical protein [Lachnospiraceae bacterium]
GEKDVRDVAGKLGVTEIVNMAGSRAVTGKLDVTDTANIAEGTNAPNKDHAVAGEQTLEGKPEDKKFGKRWFIFAGKTKSKKKMAEKS